MTPSLEVRADSFEHRIHLGVLVVEAMPCTEEVGGDALWVEEDLCAEVRQED